MATLTPCEQKAIWLDEANVALHKLITGTKVVSLSHADKASRYTEADRVALRRYRDELQAAVDCCNGVRRRHSAITLIPRGW